MDAFGTELNTLLVATYRSIGKIEAIMLEDLSAGKLSIAEMHAIESVGRGGDAGKTVTEISQDLGITPPSATVMVKRLEQKGFVIKQRCESDSRRVYIHLTERGRRADIAHRFFHRKMVNAVRRNISPDEMAVLIKAMRHINDFFGQRLTELERPDAPDEEE